MILYINSCVRDDSRTDRLARALLRKLGGDFTELTLQDANIAPLTQETLAMRSRLTEQQAFDHPLFAYARQFAEADVIVISAPLWDLSFPALLKVYLENIYVIGLVSRYGSDGRPVGLCRAKVLYYVSTAGGPFDGRFSFDYLRALATECFGIPTVRLIQADMLDVDGFDAETILRRREERLEL